MEMKRFAWWLGCGEGEGAYKVAKSIAGVRSNDAGGSFAPHFQISSGNIGGPDGLKLPGVLSPLMSSDDNDGEAKGRGGGGSDKGCSTQEDDDDDDDDEEEERLEDLELGKHKSVDDSARLLQILSSFTPEQTSRYKSYRRSGFHRSKMGKLLGILANCPISDPVAIAMCGISKMFVGELVEFGRIVMTERKDVGPIRPCHIREAYRRLKLEGKVPS